MSRWVTSFTSHKFNSSWTTLQDTLELIDTENITDDTILQEIARLKKLVEYIDKYLKLIDPEINVTNLVQVLNNLDSHIIHTNSTLSQFISNKNIAYIQQSNTHIDNCLVVIQQFNTILPKVSGQGISSMLKTYNETIKEGLKKIDLISTIQYSNAIKKLKQKLIDGIGDEESIDSQIGNMFKDTEEKYMKLLDFYNETLNDAEDNTIKELITNAKDEITQYLTKAKEEATEISNKIEDLKKFYVKIFGELDDNEHRVGGLKSELDKRIETLDTFENEQQEIHKKTLVNKLTEIIDYEKEQQLHNKNIFNQIESLLPSATSAGLAKAYHDERKKFSTPIIIWNITFIVSLLLISGVSYWTLNDLQTIEDFGKSILHSLPISGPLIWLAIYASKRRSENQRLEQEYAHKEALAKSYSSYKQQIEDLKQEDKELLTKLLETAITTISYNASETLDNKHGDNTPALEGFKSLVDELKKIIPNK
ncbi:MAG: hypothetical protein QM493_05560 [Sulfurovum sp.]